MLSKHVDKIVETYEGHIALYGLVEDEVTAVLRRRGLWAFEVLRGVRRRKVCRARRAL